MTGWTTSPDFPVTGNAWQKTVAGKSWERGDAFVTVFDREGKRIVFSTLLGNSSNAWGESITLDRYDAVYVIGNTATGFPTTDAAWRTKGSGAFVAKLDIEHAKLLYATYLGDRELQAQSAKVDDEGKIYVTGYASPDTCPTTKGAYQTTSKAESVTAFVMKLNAAGSQPVFSTMLGGSTTEWGMAISLDKQKRVYVTGRTSSDDFPTTVNALQRRKSSTAEDVFLSVLDPTGSRLESSTLMGGSRSEFPHALAVTDSGHAVVVGFTASDWFVRSTNNTHRGEMGKAFVLRFAP